MTKPQPPQQYTAKLEEKIVLNEKFTQYSFELTKPYRLDFKAGQYASVKVSDKGERRAYSICSSPGINHGFEILVDSTPDGIGVNYLKNLEFGQEIEVLAPLGIFTLKEVENEKAVYLIATGSGIAPMRSMIFDLLQEKQDARPITLMWGLRHVDQLVWVEEFENLTEHFPNFTFHPVLSKAPEEWPLCRGRVTDCLSVHTLGSKDVAPEETGYYLCGNTHMIEDVKKTLASRGINESNIHHEKFY